MEGTSRAGGDATVLGRATGAVDSSDGLTRGRRQIFLIDVFWEDLGGDITEVNALKLTRHWRNLKKKRRFIAVFERMELEYLDEIEEELHESYMHEHGCSSRGVLRTRQQVLGLRVLRGS